MFPFKFTMCLSSIALMLFLHNVELSIGLISGIDALNGEFPFMVSLRNETDKHYCGGSLITKRHILTAARCLYTDRSVLYNELEEMYDPSVLKVVLATEFNGWKDGQCIRVKKLTPHPDFNVTNNYTIVHDIAVIEMHHDVRDPNLIPISLPIEAVNTEQACHVLGWGVFYRQDQFDLNKMARYLQKAYMFVIPKQDCVTRFLQKIPELGNATQAVNNDIAFCCDDDRINTCYRDSGSPLVQNNTLGGIAIVTNDCKPRSPAIFTSVFHYLDFIRRNIDDRIIEETETSKTYKCSHNFTRPSRYN